MLGLELVMFFHAIFRYADNNGVGGPEFGGQPGKVDRFRGAAGRIVFRVEIDHNGLAAQIGQIDLAPAICGQFESRSKVAGFEFAHVFPFSADTVCNRLHR